MDPIQTSLRNELRNDLWKLADQAFGRMFAADPSGTNPFDWDFDQREKIACKIGQEVSKLILQRHMASDPHLHEMKKASGCKCPMCSEFADCVKDTKGQPRYDDRPLVTKGGKIRLDGPLFFCSRCRKLFSPYRLFLNLGPENYSPSVLKKIVFSGGNGASYDEAETSLAELADLIISSRHIERLTERIGTEMEVRRDELAEHLAGPQAGQDAVSVPPVAAVGIDGGRVRMREEGSPPGIHGPHWRETKVACVQSLSSEVRDHDPEPQVPPLFLNEAKVQALVKEMSRNRAVASPGQESLPASRSGKPRQSDKASASKGSPAPIQEGKQSSGGQDTTAQRSLDGVQRDEEIRRRTATWLPEILIRTCVASLKATMGSSGTFGNMVLGEIHRRHLDKAERRAFLGDGDLKIWELYDTYFVGWTPILDFVHLLEHLFAAARAAYGTSPEAWNLYVTLVTAAWQGNVAGVLDPLRRESARIGDPPEKAKENDPRKIVAGTIGYVVHNTSRMNYAEYRRLGLPITSCHVESLIKQFNRRVKGSEKFWTPSSVEAVLQVRAAHLSDDDRWVRFWQDRPRSLASRRRRYRRAAAG